MIKATLKKGRTKLKVKGEISDVVTDIAVMVNTIYNNLPPDNREFFRDVLKCSFADDGSLVWMLADESSNKKGGKE